MGPGITLLVLGAILTFAVRADASAVDLQTVGLIFMLAGAAIIAYYRKQGRVERVVTRIREREDGQVQTETFREVVSTEVTDAADAQALGDHTGAQQTADEPSAPLPPSPAAGPAAGPEPHAGHDDRHGDIRRRKP